jgi:alkaline phosphatase
MSKLLSLAAALASASLISLGAAQTFQRLGGCPKLGCIFPPDQVDFLAGSYFDIRLEVHAPVNGSEAVLNPGLGGQPDTTFTFTIAKKGAAPQNAATFFGVPEPQLERWNFTWFEDLFARDAKTPSLVQVAAKAYRKVALYEPGEYVATLTYYNGTQTRATWLVRGLAQARKTKNVVLFIGDGMTTSMITAARLIAHRTVNGKYQSRMMMDQFPVLGHQMTHSLDSYITDSANSATALYSGRKTTVNALNVYADSSRSPFDDPKFETIAEIFRRVRKGGVGIVSTAFIADATPGALSAHTRSRGQYGAVVDSYLNGITNYSWVEAVQPDVIFGGGAEQFYPNRESFKGQDYYAAFANEGYNVVLNKTSLLSTPNDEKTLGIFTVGNLPTWLDRNVYTNNLRNRSNSPEGKKADATDLPGLKDMTLKAIDILDARSQENGWFLMSEAASIDKQMHSLDYDRALGELLELDDAVKATVEKLRAMGQLEDTLIIVTADHGHGFDVMGSVDTKYMDAQRTDRAKREAIGTYFNSGLSQYVVQTNASIRYNEGAHFPANWDPRYTLFQGVAAFPDHREDYRVNKDGPRRPAINLTAEEDYTANYKDAPTGFLINGTLPVSADQGVHSLTDVPVFAMGPCQETFGGVYDSTEVFFHMANCFGLSRSKNSTGQKQTGHQGQN